jgi:hypothetical protein
VVAVEKMSYLDIDKMFADYRSSHAFKISRQLALDGTAGIDGALFDAFLRGWTARASLGTAEVPSDDPVKLEWAAREMYEEIAKSRLQGQVLIAVEWSRLSESDKEAYRRVSKYIIHGYNGNG